MKFVFSADLHLRSTVPVARKDDYFTTQGKLIKWLRETFPYYVQICAGDIVDRSRERAEPLTFASYLDDELPLLHGVYGNHDELHHNIELWKKTTLGFLEKTGRFRRLDKPTTFETEEEGVDPVRVYGYNYGEIIEHVPALKTITQIAVWHGYVSQEPDPHMDGKIARDLLKEFPEYDIILTGDNHQCFVEEMDGRVLINPGSFKRDTAAQKEHCPHVFVFDAATKKLEAVSVPIEWDILDDSHIEYEEARDQRLEALGKKFSEVRGLTLDYRDNLLKYIRTNDVDDGIGLLIMGWLE